MPPFGGPTEWLNSEPLGPAELGGHVVLVNFLNDADTPRVPLLSQRQHLGRARERPAPRGRQRAFLRSAVLRCSSRGKPGGSGERNLDRDVLLRVVRLYI